MASFKTSNTKFSIEIVKQMSALATSGFGLVAALAWNSLIQSFVEEYIKVWLPSGGKITSLIIYAVVVTILAVTVTYQLTKILNKLENKRDKKKKK